MLPGVSAVYRARTDLDAAARRFVERFALVLTEAGLPRMASRVFACLLVADTGQLSAGELAARLQVSPAAVSGAVRYLVQLNMVRREREPGASRDHYQIDDDMWYEVYMQRAAILKRWEQTLAEGVAVDGNRRPRTSADQRGEGVHLVPPRRAPAADGALARAPPAAAPRGRISPSGPLIGPAASGSARGTCPTLAPRRGVAQPGSAPALGAGGRGFKSPLPDHTGGRSASAPSSTWTPLSLAAGSSSPSD